MPKLVPINQRYWVPDLSPRDRQALRKIRPRAIFVAESPHVSEIEPDREDQRRPLCGMAGRQWWGLLSEILEGQSNPDVGLDHLIAFCAKHRIVVLNAVQSPLDPKIGKTFPEAEPVKNLGFSKQAGPHSFKKLKGSAAVKNAIQALADRLKDESLRKVPIYCLGNDSEWFVSQVVDPELRERVGDKIPHPSAWWRRGGLYGRMAREKLSKIFGKEIK